MKGPIYKYVLDLNLATVKGGKNSDGNMRLTIPFPAVAKILALDYQRGKVTIWAIAGLGSPMDEREFIIAPTGFTEVDTEWNYVGSAIGDFCWHVFTEDKV